MEHNLLEWHRSQDEIQCALRSQSGFSALKIILKTKDDPFFLKGWVDHHANLVGLQNLIVFDNGSQDPAVYSYYNHNPDLLVFSYRGFHNTLHHTEMFAPLYTTLPHVCRFFTVLDGDERLVMLSGNGNVVNSDVVSFLEDNKQVMIFPGTWLANDFGSARIFRCGTQPNDQLLHGLRWGKPVIRADRAAKGFINHNMQAVQIGVVLDDRVRLNFFVLHLCNLSRRQRIDANKKKLIARGVVKDGTSIEEIIDLEVAGHPDSNVTLYVSEIQKLARAEEFHSTEVLRSGYFRPNCSGPSEFYSDTERALLRDYISFPELHVHKLVE